MARRNNLFTTIKTEGGLLPSDLLQKISVSDKSLDGLSLESYHLNPNERINEAASRSWKRIVNAWNAFRSAAEILPESDRGTTVTRERWLLILFQELGYGRLSTSKAVEIKGKSYPISHFWKKSPIHLVGFRIDIDKPSKGVAGAARTSPHSLVQEFLNSTDEYLWAFVSNGLRLRILRDNVSLTRQAYIEFDLEAMMDGEVYSDFAMLWLLCHQSRVEADKPEDCWLERWAQTAKEQGTRALDSLRSGVEDAIKQLGSGFLLHPDNGALRKKLRAGELSTQDYYRQLLRMVYRLIFLFVAEDRNLLFSPDASEDKKEFYLNYYSASRLRRLSEKMRGTKHSDLYQALKVVMNKLGEDKGCSVLGLPALGSFLWSSDAVKDLSESELSNSSLLEAVRKLTFMIEGKILRGIDYKNLGSEELGSVYESLLELHPEFNIDAGTFDLKTVSGHERKTTGSYYTPSSLIQCLLDSALDPVVDEALKKDNPESAILSLKVCDPACGSGHFLIAAAHRVAKRLAAVRTGNDEPSPEDTRKALRDVIGHCIYGVDINPMAIELCKVGLWMEAIEPGKPLSFLDHRILCGNSLLGTTPKLLKDGIPDDAFKPIEGDDKSYCQKYKKLNKDERKQEEVQFKLFEKSHQPWEKLGNLATAMVNIDDIDDSDIKGIQEKQKRYAEFVKSSGYLFGRFLADSWCSSFVWKKRESSELAYPMTEEVFRRIEKNPHAAPPWLKAEVERLGQQYQFFHWHLMFPDVFRIPKEGEVSDNEQTGWSGGFNVVLGNPPWDKVQPEETKFFASTRSDIANSKGKLRKILIEKLSNDDPVSYNRWITYKREIEGISSIVKNSKFMKLTSLGNLNTYRLFAEIGALIISMTGRSGLIVQTGLATDETGKHFLNAYLEKGQFHRFLDFENKGVFFPDVHGQFRFALLTIGGKSTISPDKGGEFGWLLHSLSELSVKDRLVHLTKEDIDLFNPSSGTLPVFTSERDLQINKRIYQCGQHIFIDDNNNFAKIRFQGELFNMTRDSNLFIKNPDDSSLSYLELYEAKFIHQFDHRFAMWKEDNSLDCSSSDKVKSDFKIKTRYYVERDEVVVRAEKQGIIHKWMLGFRSVSSATNERTAIVSIFPFVGVGNSINLIIGLNALQAIYLMANANTYLFDYCCRNKMSGMNLNIWIFKQLPLINLIKYKGNVQWDSITLSEWIILRVLELVYTAWDMKPLAEDCNYYGAPFIWDEDRRFLLRCELDSAYFHLYGIERDNVDYIMETFPIVKQRDIEKHGEYRTKRVLLEIYDEMTEAIHTSKPYQTRLDPPPADPSITHPVKEEMIELPAIDESVLVATSYPATETDKAICAASLAIVEQADGLSSMDHLDALLLSSHPEWCKLFLDQKDHVDLSRAVASAPKELFVSAGQSLRWKECRDYLEDQRKGITVDHMQTDQTISLGIDFIKVKNSFPPGTDKIVEFALKALKHVKEIRDDVSLSQELKTVLQGMIQQHKYYSLVA